jgi:uncharacterized membrane protein
VNQRIFFQKAREVCRQSLWILPGIMGLTAIALALGLLLVDDYYRENFSISWIQDLTQRRVTTTLSTMLAAILTVFGILMPLIFSILLRASNQFTPKILKIYRSALFPKLFLGIMLATTLYLMTLISVLNFFLWVMPLFSLLVAFILIIVTIYSLPPFFDRLTTSLEPTYLAKAITDDMKKILEKLETLKATPGKGHLAASQDRSFLEINHYTFSIVSPKTGYIEAIEVDKLLELCVQRDVIAAIPIRVGDFVLKGNPIAYLNSGQEPDKEYIDKMQQYFSWGSKRLGIADLELQLEELLSITVRALSPGITDLSTAIECINHIGATCNLLLNRRLHPGIHQDKKGIIHLFSKEFDFFGFAHAAFDTIRQNAYTQPAIILQVLQILERLINNCQSRERANILREIAHQFLEEAEGKHLVFDRKKMQLCLAQIEASCSDLSKV